ncbi:hypothetical protein SK128_023729 [Halocaridina rubra]|uniref:Chitin-binding type-2 domain-containing protein n=1 Tax=Halocaridina rubra TaxID=373956 RepID=A0AAN8X9K0_HALRR
MKTVVLAVLLGLAVADRPSNGYGAPRQAPSNSYGPPSGGYGVDSEIEALAENIPGGGVPGEDYPILASVPDTGFDCDEQDVPGYYADTDREAGCQVFHICQDRPYGRQQDSFLCPNGTIFNQQYLVCDWWFNFDCDEAEDFYSVNELIGVVPYGPKMMQNIKYGSNGSGMTNGYGSNGNDRSMKNNGYGSNGNGMKKQQKKKKNSGKRKNNNNGYGSNGNGRMMNGY